MSLVADLDITRNQLANLQLSSPVPNKTAGQKAVALDVASLKTYLLSNGYTAAQLNAMTKNDLVYAARQVPGFAAL